MSSILIETSRLTVRTFTEADAKALHAVLSDPAVMRYIEPPFSIEKTRRFIREAGAYSPPQVYAVVWKPTGALIGHLIWHPWNEGAMELGWILRRDFWGQGIARELTEALLAQAACDVVLECAGEQRATKRIAEHFGFVWTGHVDGLDIYRHFHPRQPISQS